MMFNDDEEVPLVDQEESTGSKPKAFIAGKTQLRSYNKNKITFNATKFTVLLELEGKGNQDDTPEVDIVTVLDISGSMGDDNKIDKLKNAMQFLIKKLSSNHRLSVVTFSTTATRRCPLRRMTEQAQKEVGDMVNSLHAGGGTNIAAGLRLGLKVLEERKQTRGRVAAIMLMSDGDQGPKYEDARDVLLDNVPVFTFGFGKGRDYNPEVLNAIATKSKGGTFSVADVDNTESNNLNVAFAISLGGLLTTVVQDLELTITRAKSSITINGVSVKLYPIKKDDDSQTISFGHLYTGEKRRILVDLDLPAATNEAGYEVLDIDYSFNYDGEPFEANPITISVFRTKGAVDAENETVATEETRNKTVDKMKNATTLADQGNFNRAKNELEQAQVSLEAAALNFVIHVLKSQVTQLLELMQDPQIYKDKGRHIALALLTSHDRQRMAAIGDDPTKDGLFDTPTVKKFVEQAIEFIQNPDKPIEPFSNTELIIPDPVPDPDPLVQDINIVQRVLGPFIALFGCTCEWLAVFGKFTMRD